MPKGNIRASDRFANLGKADGTKNLSPKKVPHQFEKTEGTSLGRTGFNRNCSKTVRNETISVFNF